MSFWGIYSIFYNSALKEWFPYQHLIRDLIDNLEVGEGDNILDAGCGGGFLIRKIIEENQSKRIKITGIDYRPEMINFAKRKCANFSDVDFKIADLNKKIKFPNDSFNKIVCCNTLYALENPEKVISEFYRILKPGGVLVVTNPKPENRGKVLLQEQIKSLKELTPISKKLYHIFLFFLLTPVSFVIIIMNKIISDRAKKGKYHFLDKKELEAIYQKPGFRNIRISSTYANQNLLVRGEK